MFIVGFLLIIIFNVSKFIINNLTIYLNIS